VWTDLRSALQNLQYRPKEIDAVVEQLASGGVGGSLPIPIRRRPDAPFEELFRAALRILRK